MNVNPLTELRAVVGKYQTQKQAADALRISPSLLTDILKRRRGFSDTLLRRLGLVRRISFERRAA